MYDDLLTITGLFLIRSLYSPTISTRIKLSALGKRLLKTTLPNAIMRLNWLLKPVDLSIYTVLTIPLTRTEKQGFKGQIADKYKLKQSSELILDSANGNYW